MTTTIYLMLMAALGAMLSHIGATTSEWEYWAVLLIAVGIFLCGRETA